MEVAVHEAADYSAPRALRRGEFAVKLAVDDIGGCYFPW
jgi:hypothetical protein